MGIVETEEPPRAKVMGVCRNYYLQVWNKALNKAKVEASSALRRVKSVYYPPVICTPGSASSKIDTSSEVEELGKASSAKVLPSSNKPFEEAQQ